MSCRQIVYMSEATVTFDRLRLVALLIQAREYNAKEGITGVLLHSPGLFVQCLEGDSDRIEKLYRKIQSDPRHQAIVCVQDLEMERPFFPDWSMGCVEAHDSDLLRISNESWEKRTVDAGDAGWLSSGFVMMRCVWESRRAEAF